jgi:hypothetical protein
MKFFNWLSKLIVTTIIISTLTLVVTFFMVDMYAGKVLKQFNIEVSDSQTSISDFIAHFSGKENRIEEDKITAAPERTEMIESIESEPDVFEPAESEYTEPKNNGVSEMEQEAVEVWNQNAGSSEEVIITAEQFNKKKDELTNADKMKVFSMIISKVPQHEIQVLSQLMEDGVTKEELIDIKAIMLKYLNAEEYEELMNILTKYDE